MDENIEELGYKLLTLKSIFICDFLQNWKKNSCENEAIVSL